MAETITPTARRTILASFLGSTFEWFDFGLYGTTATLVFDQVFFPTTSTTTGTLLSLTTTAVGYFTRPIGGIIFGHFGDRGGRKQMLVFTMLLMGIPTVVIGLIPGYATIGIAAPIILLIMRLLQGIGLGGEYAGAALAAIESVPDKRRGFVGTIPQIGNPVGGLLGSISVLACTALSSDAQFAEWVWRIPFLVSAVLLVYTMMVRLRLAETDDFRQLKQSRGVQRSPLLTVVRRHWGLLLLGLGARCADAITGNVAGAVVTAYVVTYLHLSNQIGLAGTVIASLIAIPFMLYIGKIGDRFGRKRTFFWSMGSMVVTTFPMFILLDTKIFVVMVIGVTVFRITNSLQFAVQSSFLSDVFPVEVRYTAISLVYQVSAIIGGLTAPAAYAILIASDGAPWWLATATVGSVLLSMGCVLAMRSKVVHSAA